MATKTNNRYLTKTLFGKALECPTMLYYHKKDEYAVMEDDAFQEALDEGKELEEIQSVIQEMDKHASRLLAAFSIGEKPCQR